MISWLARGPVFYGWIIVGATFAQLFVGFVVLYSLGAYFEPHSQEFSASRGSVSLVFALTASVSHVSCALAGLIADRFGPRLLGLGAAAAYLAGLGLAAQAGALWQIYLPLGLFAGAAVAFGFVPAIATVQRWFQVHRALASGLAMAGTGLGTLAGAALSTWLIASAGWRTSFVVTGIIAAVLTGLGAYLMIRTPADLGLTPDGARDLPAASGAGIAPPAPPADRSTREALRSGEFRWTYLSAILTGLPIFLVVAHIVPYALDAGFGGNVASLGIGAIGLGGVVGRLVLGPVADRFGRLPSYGLTMGLISALMLVWLVLPGGAAWPLLVFAGLFGIAFGGWSALNPVVMAELFGVSRISGTIGVFFTGIGLGSLTGSWLGGVLFDLVGSYRPGMILGAVSAALACLIIFRLQARLQPALGLAG